MVECLGQRPYTRSLERARGTIAHGMIPSGSPSQEDPAAFPERLRVEPVQPASAGGHASPLRRADHERRRRRFHLLAVASAPLRFGRRFRFRRSGDVRVAYQWVWCWFRYRFQTQTRRRATDDDVFNRGIDQDPLWRRGLNRRFATLTPLHWTLSLETFLFIAASELGCEPLRTHARSRPLGVGEQ